MSDASKESPDGKTAGKEGMARPLFIILFLAICAALIGLDQWTKVLAERFLAGRGAISMVGDLATLVFAQNTGAFLSLGAGLNEPLRIIGLIVLPSLLLAAAVAYLCFWQKTTVRNLSLACLLASGGFGNIIDRIFKKQVTDFLNFGLGGLRTGVMNVADLYILALVVILVVLMVRENGKDKAKKGRDA
jgi:signal peptidase II